MPPNASRNKNRVDALLASMEAAIPNNDIKIQNVFAPYLVILASGHVEISSREIIKNFALRQANAKIGTFVEYHLERENSLNCEKISKILGRFDPNWYSVFESTTGPNEKEAVDSLKTLRDQIAHGKHNGTGFITVKTYYKDACRYVDKLDAFFSKL